MKIYLHVLNAVIRNIEHHQILSDRCTGATGYKWRYQCTWKLQLARWARSWWKLYDRGNLENLHWFHHHGDDDDDDDINDICGEDIVRTSFPYEMDLELELAQLGEDLIIEKMLVISEKISQLYIVGLGIR